MERTLNLTAIRSLSLCVFSTALAFAAPSAAFAADGADWLPLRGSSIKVGCTWNNGCGGGYHTSGAKAIDFFVPSGTPVFAAGSGTIFQAMDGCAPRSTRCAGRDRGNFITIKHGSRYSRYLHLSGIVKSSGSVTAGQLIGYSGNSGQKAADHLHYDELTNPTSGTGKLDPGALTACHGSTKKSYSNWSSVAYNTLLRNDGYELGCATGTVSIFALANSRYVSSELSYTGNRNGMLRARATSVGTWEKYAIVGNCWASSGCALRAAANGRYVSAEIKDPGSQNGMLRARATSVGTWEKFRISGDCTTGCALKSLANSKWVSAEKAYSGSGNGMLRARATSVGGWEGFLFKPS
jgi:Peptidase family M23